MYFQFFTSSSTFLSSLQSSIFCPLEFTLNVHVYQVSGVNRHFVSWFSLKILPFVQSTICIHHSRCWASWNEGAFGRKVFCAWVATASESTPCVQNWNENFTAGLRWRIIWLPPQLRTTWPPASKNCYANYRNPCSPISWSTLSIRRMVRNVYPP